MSITNPRGTSNGNVSGNSEDRRRRKVWLVETYRADFVLVLGEFDTAPRPVSRSTLVFNAYGYTVQECCRCYRCGTLLTVETLTVDRITPGCQGGTYRRNNIRPACSGCNSKTGGGTRGKK